MKNLITFCFVFVFSSVFGQDGEFIDAAYEYAMNAEKKISDLEEKNGKLHCEIHDYIVQENNMRNTIDSLRDELECQIQSNGENISSFKLIFGYLLMIIAVLLLYLLIKKR